MSTGRRKRKRGSIGSIGSIEELSKDWTCPICLEVICNISSLGCGHNYCHDCINDHQRDRTKKSCPVCRALYIGNPMINLSQKKILERIGGQEYCDLQKKRLNDKMIKDVKGRMGKSELFKMICDILDSELKENDYLEFDDLMNRAIKSLHKKYEFAILYSLEESYHSLGNKVIGRKHKDIYKFISNNKLTYEEVGTLLYKANIIEIGSGITQDIIDSVNERELMYKKYCDYSQKHGEEQCYSELDELLQQYE